MIVYKLTDKNGMTQNETQWGPGVCHSLPRIEEPCLCQAGLIHSYATPLMATLMSPCYGYEEHDSKLWLAETPEIIVSDGLKLGCYELRTIHEVDKVECRLESRVRFGIASALAVYKDNGYKIWADGWISGRDRTAEAAWAARAAATAGAGAAATAAWAAWAAKADAADAAVNAAKAAVNAARAAARAAKADAAEAAVNAAYAADAAVDFTALAEWAITQKERGFNI